MPRDIELVKQELESSTTSIFITKWILEHTPYVFEDYETEYISWRHEIAEKLRIDARDIIITGSASLGFSLNPNKNFKSFDKKSDIDISIISHHYFDVAWHDLIVCLLFWPKFKTLYRWHKMAAKRFMKNCLPSEMGLPHIKEKAMTIRNLTIQTLCCTLPEFEILLT